ncbi:nitrilase-related carbon-nitrogen hydrolase, partial [Nocardia neocaledoniensis]|uniref:nitrilase-related carbon-nitrogen hydrolase n=1 Tax=Nocardia neocaledoniensis TaxID=236511 RepID=UPI002458F728
IWASAASLIAATTRSPARALNRTPASPGAFQQRLLVRDTTVGRIGVLGGADHLRPALRARMQEEREQIHVAAWSGFTVYYGEGKEWGPELNTSASVRYAMDSATYVLAPVAVVPVAGWEVVDARLPDRRLLRGGGGVSRIFGPGGLELTPPLDEGAEGLLFADIDVSRGLRTASAQRGSECRTPSGRIARREPARA